MTETNSIDEVMRRLLEDPTLATPGDIDTLITYQRQQKANFDAGIKPTKRAGGKVNVDEVPSISLQSIGMKKAPEPGKGIRRI